VLEHLGTVPPRPDADERRLHGRMDELLSIAVHDPDFHTGRRFDLAGSGVA
jgi:uncharacterized protein (DUF934 family)